MGENHKKKIAGQSDQYIAETTQWKKHVGIESAGQTYRMFKMAESRLPVHPQTVELG